MYTATAKNACFAYNNLVSYITAYRNANVQLQIIAKKSTDFGRTSHHITDTNYITAVLSVVLEKTEVREALRHLKFFYPTVSKDFVEWVNV